MADLRAGGDRLADRRPAHPLRAPPAARAGRAKLGGLAATHELAPRRAVHASRRAPLPRSHELRLLGGVLLAATPLGAAAPALARGRSCTPFDLERTRKECDDLSREIGRKYVLCRPPGGSADRCWAACCRSGEYCCITPSGGITCCDPFFGGVCSKDPRTRDACRGACRPGEWKCGSRCCAKGQGCRGWQRRKKCGEKKKACCIAGETCCRDKCCSAKEKCCVNHQKTMCCPPGFGCAVPILAGDIGIKPRTPAICCPPERLHVNPKLCCPPGQVALRGPGIRVGPGRAPSAARAPGSATESAVREVSRVPKRAVTAGAWTRSSTGSTADAAADSAPGRSAA